MRAGGTFYQSARSAMRSPIQLVDVDRPDFVRHPDFREARVLEVHVPAP